MRTGQREACWLWLAQQWRCVGLNLHQLKAENGAQLGLTRPQTDLDHPATMQLFKPCELLPDAS